MIKGRLKSWNEEKGFGFISSETTERDVFVHISALKSMSRKPMVGDVIYFNTEQQADGKIRAINCEIEGVAVVEKRPSQSNHKYKNNKQSNTKFPLVTIVILIVIGVFAYQKWGSFMNHSPITNYEKFDTLAPDFMEDQAVNFVCDGRTHCSEMNSRAEAVFFINNCPDTRMDGDRDGIPCENDSRFKKRW